MNGQRLLIYSHDSYGLGHLRRCQTIANHLTATHEDLAVIIITGSPVVGSFDFHPRVDFIRVPGIVKLDGNTYASSVAGLAAEEMMEIRSVIILETARRFRPDVFLVDKEPLGLRGEVREALGFLRREGTRNVLGIREVLDDTVLLKDEWERKGALDAVETLYDDIWIYGPRDVYRPLDGLGLSDKALRRARYTGYLRRVLSDEAPPMPEGPVEPYLLVHAGGGGDGALVIDWVISAYERDPALPWRSRIVFGPFLSADEKATFRDRIAAVPKLSAETFVTNMEALVDGASGLVTMGGYNTFCEMLSFDKPTLMVPRTRPRLEQYIRATRAEELGLLRVMLPDGERDPERMAAALRALPDQPPPSAARLPGLLSGLEEIDRLFVDAVAERRRRPALIGIA
ncbi:membrane protein [Aureimonas endophytica]|uniref:Membrane protein n=1 Tax=Aureimonas endophytica TaxID=2027858 RepID=A0A916ZVJ8_9HYPH|nr:glycosyltransferase [Aureimonas endophytica]GGE15847.1 membrane protein [Aureimonas endophytica]